jgi:methionine synthase II (cobalamin-independent)
VTAASGVGSHPGSDQDAYDEALRLVLGELPDLPYLPEVPGRGAPAGLTGRSVALLSGLAADLQPAGWRLSTAAGVDHRRAVSLLAQDLDALEEQAEGYVGPMKTQVAGPWTLAATVERPRGDRVLADVGARRDLAQSLAEGLVEHLADLRRRVPGASWVVQVDEPALPAVLAGAVPTASGLHRHRTVEAPVAAQALDWVLDAVRSAGAEAVVHCCADDVPLDLLAGLGGSAGAPGLSLDLDRLAAGGYDAVAEALEADRRVMLGVVPAVRPPVGEPEPRSVTERVERFLDVLGLAPGSNLVLTPSCGLAGADPGWVRTALDLCRTAARDLTA